MEIQYIRQLKPRFNFTDGGGGTSGFQHSEETKKKMSENMKGENNPMYEKTVSEETRKKISEARNTTGFYRVCKHKTKTCKQGFAWCYRYQNENKRRKLSSVSLSQLEKKSKSSKFAMENY